MWSSSGTKSRRAASLTFLVLRFGAVFVKSGVGSGAGAGSGGRIGSGIGTGVGVGSGMGAGVDIGSGAGTGAGAGGIGVVSGGTLSSGMLIGSNGAIGSGAGATISTFGSGNGPTGSPNSPVSPSGTEEGAATGSEKTGSILVVLVILSIAFCRSLSTV